MNQKNKPLVISSMAKSHQIYRSISMELELERSLQGTYFC